MFGAIPIIKKKSTKLKGGKYRILNKLIYIIYDTGMLKTINILENDAKKIDFIWYNKKVIMNKSEPINQYKSYLDY